MSDKPASEQIDDIIKNYRGWKGEILARVRSIIRAADPEIIETVKWKTASRPEGLPVWELNGIICIAETWKDNIKLVFFKGALMSDPDKLFNARLKSSTDRAIEFREGDAVDEPKLTRLVQEAVAINEANK